MPLWLEILINVIGYAGFIAIAMYHKPGKDERSDEIYLPLPLRSPSVVGKLLQGRVKTQAAVADQRRAENLGLVIGKGSGKAAGNFLSRK